MLHIYWVPLMQGWRDEEEETNHVTKKVFSNIYIYIYIYVCREVK